jgi:PAS domain S-box-containing protein
MGQPVDGPDRLRLLERAVTASTNSIVITDPNLPDDPLVYVNPAFERTTGYAAEEVLGRNCRFLQDEDRHQPALEELRTAIHEGRECTVVLRNYRKDRALFWNELSIYPVRDEGGRVANFVGVQNDITERIRAEQTLAEIRRAERRRIARDLHDIVLQDLAGALQSLRLTDLQAKGAKTGLDLGEELRALRRATSGLRNAIYDLRQEGGRPFMESVESLVQLNRQLMPGCEVVLTVDEGFPESLPGGASVELLRVLQEALANARRHSGAMHLEVRLRRQEDEYVAAEVEDGGRGFDRKSVRAGVGLSAMRERIAGLGGKIEIASRPGEGTKVAVRVPVGDGNPTPPRL